MEVDVFEGIKNELFDNGFGICFSKVDWMLCSWGGRVGTNGEYNLYVSKGDKNVSECIILTLSYFCKEVPRTSIMLGNASSAKEVIAVRDALRNLK